MCEIKYNTLQECEAVMQTLKAIGQPMPVWLQQQYDAFKATEKAKEVAKNSDTPIYDTLVANYPYGIMPQEKKKCIEDTVSQLLEEGERAEEPGLLLGKIQCGKTDTFEDIIGLAFDKGIDVAIVFTKGTKPLAEQTIKRMKNDYRFFKASDDLSQKATINIYDIMDVWKKLKQAKVERGKTVIVCKKQATNLAHLIDMFNIYCPFMKQKKVLVVDDEADFASRNYRSVRLEMLTDDDGNPIPQPRETEMAKISQQIDDFRKIPVFCRYLQVTATPYCLYLQPQGELNLNGNVVKPFKPRFTSLVPIHDRYIGGREYFELSKNPESMYSHLFHQVSQKCMDVLGHEDKRYINNSVSSNNIYDLTTTLVYYFMGTAVRRIQVRTNEFKNYSTSALIHVELDKKNHEWQEKIINRLIKDIAKSIIENDRTDQRIWFAIDMVYDDFVESNRKGRVEGLIDVEMPSKEDVLKEVREILNPENRGYHVQVVNSDEQVSSLLSEETGELELDTDANIFIGGNILDRGITIKNMLCFFYGRNPKNFQQDTVLQHARMYGARSKEDMAVTRLHTTAMIHKILVRMNDLDNQLREWFLAGKDKMEPNAIFIGYDKNIKPCSSQKIKVSNTLTLKSQTRILPIGFWTGSNTAINKIVKRIDYLIINSSNYANQDENGFFEMNKQEVLQILQLIESTYVYDSKHNNMDRINDVKEMMCAVEYCSDQSADKMYVLHRTNRNMSRVRANGSWVDAPDDGHTDLAPSRNKAQDTPVIMFIRQNGAKCKDPLTGEDMGWNNAAFYWPVLLTQKDLNPVMYALDQNKRSKVTVVDNSDILDGIDEKEVLKLTYSGDLVEHFGKEGTDYSASKNNPVEIRTIKETTAAKYLLKNTDGTFVLNSSVKLDMDNNHGVYTRNGNRFPFVLRPYKYMLLSNGRDSIANLMLLELEDINKWNVYPEGELDENGYLRDVNTGNILLHGEDYIMNKQMKKKLFRDDTITQWVIYYPIKKVLRFKKNR